MTQNSQEIVINQTLLVWSIVVIVELFILAYMMYFPLLILFAFFMILPIKAAMNWVIPAAKTQLPEAVPDKQMTEKEA